MMALSLISLCVFIFSAYAYAATTLLALREAPVWGGRNAPWTHRNPRPLDPVVLALCVVCTVWFIVHSVIEFELLVGRTQVPVAIDVLAFVLTYSFPPLIMHTMLRDSTFVAHGGERRRRWALPVWAMYVLSFATGTYVLAADAGWAWRPRPFAMWTGISIGLLFTLCSIYSIVLMTVRAPEPALGRHEPAQQRGLRRTMIVLFLTMIPLFFALIFLHDKRLLAEALGRVTRTLPIFFLIASVYFENRFDFYDLIVKRAAMSAGTLLLLGGFLLATLGALERLPTGSARPWLFAVALLPVAILLPWLHRTIGRALDQLWFGREFTPVEAVKQVLSAMQPATDENTLVAATESRLSDMFHARVRILFGDEPAPRGAFVETLPAQPNGASVRVAVVREPGSRPLLSEDLSLLRSLVSVFGYMLENVRLQRRRQEQDQMAQELRLQTSRSELKALRAQINPHFLFNALNAIASLIHTNPTRADAAVEQLAEVFRYTLRRSEQEWAALDQEVAFAQAYLDVEQARFGRRLSYVVTVTPPASAAQVPAMMLHTLVENAVKHGISQVRGTGRIEIHAKTAGETLIVDVSDTGPGPNSASYEHAPGESFGLRSIRDRLRGHFADRASLDLVRDDARGVTIARIVMPLMREPAAVSKMIRAFLVDDEPPARARLRQLLAEAGDVLVVGEAANAEDARDAIVSVRPDVVFLDIEMPEERGTALAASLPEPRPFIVFATAFDRYAIDAFNVAATDYLLKPITRARLAGTLARVRQRLGGESEFRSEMVRASAAQAQLLPQALPDVAGYQCAARTIPARAVGGDFYLAERLVNGHVAFVLGDVIGKGVPAGLVASSVQARIETMARHSDWQIDKVLAELNRALASPTGSVRFATLAWIELSPQSGRIRVVNAGHPPLVVAAADGSRQLIESTGPALGLISDARFESRALDLAEGDVLVAYSDGVTESVDEHAEELGVAGLADEIERHADVSADRLCQIILDFSRDHRGGAPAADDASVLVIKRDSCPSD